MQWVMERHSGLGTEEATIPWLTGIRHVHRPPLHHLQLHLLGQGPLSIPRPSYLHTHAHTPSGQRHQRTQSGFTASLWLHRLSGPAGDTHTHTRTHTYTSVLFFKIHHAESFEQHTLSYDLSQQEERDTRDWDESESTPSLSFTISHSLYFLFVCLH